jgi:WD40 repeat protein
LNDDKAGLKFRCKQCGHVVSVPAADDDLSDIEVLESGAEQAPRDRRPTSQGPTSQRKQRSQKSRGEARRTRQPTGAKRSRKSKPKKGGIPTWAWIVGGGCLTVAMGLVLIVGLLFWSGYKAGREGGQRIAREIRQARKQADQGIRKPDRSRRGRANPSGNVKTGPAHEGNAPARTTDEMLKSAVTIRAEPPVRQLVQPFVEVPILKAVRVLPSEPYRVQSLAVSPDSQTVYAATQLVHDRKTVKRPDYEKILSWSIGSGQVLDNLTHPNGGGIPSLAASPDGATIAYSGRREKIVLMDAASFNEKSSWNRTRGLALGFLRFSSDGKQLAMVVQTDVRKSINTIRIYDIASGRVQDLSGLSEEHDIRGLEYSPDGKKLIAVSHVKTYSLDEAVEPEIQIWNAHPPRLDKRIISEQGSGSFRAMSATSSGETIVTLSKTASGRDRLCFWDSSTAEWVSDWASDDSGVLSVPWLAISPDGKYLATGSTGTRIGLWDVQSHRLVASLRAGDKRFGSDNIVFSPDGNWLIVGSERTSDVVVWDLSAISSPPQ